MGKELLGAEEESDGRAEIFERFRTLQHFAGEEGAEGYRAQGGQGGKEGLSVATRRYMTMLCCMPLASMVHHAPD